MRRSAATLASFVLACALPTTSAASDSGREHVLRGHVEIGTAVERGDVQVAVDVDSDGIADDLFILLEAQPTEAVSRSFEQARLLFAGGWLIVEAEGERLVLAVSDEAERAPLEPSSRLLTGIGLSHSSGGFTQTVHALASEPFHDPVAYPVQSAPDGVRRPLRPETP